MTRTNDLIPVRRSTITDWTLDEALGRIVELEHRVLELAETARHAILTARHEVEAARRESGEVRQYSESQAAKLLKISRNTLAKERKQRNYPHQRNGRTIRYSGEQLKEIQELRQVGKRRDSSTKTGRRQIRLQQ